MQTVSVGGGGAGYGLLLENPRDAELQVTDVA